MDANSPSRPAPPPAAPAAFAPTSTPSREARERVIQLLSHHFAEDRLSMAEFENRVAAAYAAPGMTELEALVADLPPASPAPASLAERASNTPPATSESVPATGRMTAVLSSNERRGRMTVPQHLTVVAVLGNAELDLRGAIFGAGVTEIEVRAVFGNVEITVPAGVLVESTGQAFLASFGTTACAANRQADDEHAAVTAAVRAPEVVLRVTGRAVMANVEIRSARPRAEREESRRRRLEA